MKKILIATLAIFALMFVGVAQAEIAVPTQTVKQKAKKFNVKKKHIKRYNLKNPELRKIKKAKKWAKTPKVRSVRNCESNNRYGINTGNGYYGAYQFNYETWKGVGGQKYSKYPHQSHKVIQDFMAWKLYQQRGWQPWTCA